MTTNKYDFAMHLQQGIAAAKSGKNKTAQIHLKAVLAQSPDSVPALLWLAFVTPAPQTSVALLERVLELEPNNAQAKLGLDWARQRAATVNAPAVDMAETAAPAEVVPSIGDVSPVEIEPEAALLPQIEAHQQPLAVSGGDTRPQVQAPPKKKRPKVAAAPLQTRRRLSPLMAAAVILGAAILLMVGIGALMFGPSNPLTAWLPASLARNDAAVAPEAALLPVVAQSNEPTLATHFTTLADTIVIKKPAAVKPEAAAVQFMTLAPGLNLAASPNVTNPADIATVNLAPINLIGPANELLFGPRLFVPVDASLLAHQPISPTEKWIEVVLSEQRVTAWEGNTPVMSFLTSTGLPNTPTVQGEYNIYWKLASTLMSGPDYYLPEVPYTMYFYAGYALHGAYWHDNFGQPMSHGCVNLSIENSKTLFEWADPVLPAGQTQVTATQDNPGTLVVVHE